MKFMKTFKLLMGLLFLFGVSCSDIEQESESFSISTALSIAVVNEQGLDLLNPQSPNNYDVANIKVFHEIDGVLTEYFKGWLDAPKGYIIYNPREYGNNEQFLFCLHATDEGSIKSFTPTTYIQWNEYDMDTIQCHYLKNGTTLITAKVLFNGEEVWNVEKGANKDRIFQVIKR